MEIITAASIIGIRKWTYTSPASSIPAALLIEWTFRIRQTTLATKPREEYWPSSRTYTELNWGKDWWMKRRMTSGKDWWMKRRMRFNW